MITFETILNIYKERLFATKVRFDRKLLTESERDREWGTAHFMFSELKQYLDEPYYKRYDAECFLPENWEKLQEKYADKDEKPYQLLVYRGVVIPMYIDDYGQQDYTVLFGKVHGGGAYNFCAAEDFCSMVDYHLEKIFMEDRDADWLPDDTDPILEFINSTLLE